MLTILFFVDVITAARSLEPWFIEIKNQLEVNQSVVGLVESFVVKFRASDPRAVVRRRLVGMVESSGSKVKEYLVRKKVRFKNSDKELKLLLMEKQPGLLSDKRLPFSEDLLLIYFKVHMLYVVDDAIASFYNREICNEGGGVSVNYINLMLLLFVTEFHAAKV